MVLVDALRRSDIDLTACTIRIERTLIELQNGQLSFGPPKSAAGRRTVVYLSSSCPSFAPISIASSRQTVTWYSSELAAHRYGGRTSGNEDGSRPSTPSGSH